MIDYPNKGKVWLAEEVEQLRHGFAQDLTLEELVEAHGRTPAAIISKMASMGLIIALPTGWHRIEQDPWTISYPAYPRRY